MTSLKRLSNPASFSHSSLYSTFCMSPTTIKKCHIVNQKQNFSRKSSKANLSSKVSRPVSRKQSSEKKLDKKPSKPKAPRKIHKLQKSSMPVFRIPFYCVPQDKDNLNQVVKPEKTLISRSDFVFKSRIGAGGFGQVWKVEYTKNNRLYALKQISKIKVIVKKSVNSILNEKQILLTLYNPFIVNMKCSFQDKQKLYLVIDYLSGGDLRYRLFHEKSFNEEQAKFMIACIVLALEYLRESNIIHRDLKPENLVFQGTGYLRLTDFGVSRIKKEDNANQTSGTPGYMSPEVICKQNHSFEADYFALGVIAYQLMLRKRPYNGSRKQIRQQILAKQVKIKKDEVPLGWSGNAMDFINKLISRKKQTRLGYGNIQQIKKHPWMSNIDWNKLKNKQAKIPFKAKAVGETVDYLKQVEITSSESENHLQYQEQRLLLRNKQIQDLFSNYYNSGSFKMYQNKNQSQKSTFCTRDD